MASISPTDGSGRLADWLGYYPNTQTLTDGLDSFSLSAIRSQATNGCCGQIAPAPGLGDLGLRLEASCENDANIDRD